MVALEETASKLNARFTVYDESYILQDGTASTQPGTGSELWIIDASKMTYGMEAVVCRIKLPQRVPYGWARLVLPC